jgi:hypothetical protein
MKLSVFRKYGYAISEQTRKLSNDEIKGLVKKYRSVLMKNKIKPDEDGLFKLVIEYKIPDGRIKPKNYYPIIDGDDATKIRNHILSDSLISKEHIENYEVLLNNWAGTFGDLIDVSKKL